MQSTAHQGRALYGSRGVWPAGSGFLPQSGTLRDPSGSEDTNEPADWLVLEWNEVRSRRRTVSLALLAVAGVVGTAGCVSQPWQLPDPYGYGSGSGASSHAYPYGSGAYGYGSRYGYGSPYYYSYRQGAPYYYPGYGYPSYPGYYCRDADRNGRCDNRQGRYDDDKHHGDKDDDGGKGHDGSPPRLGEQPFKEVRRHFRQVEPSGSSTSAGSRAPRPAVVTPAPAARSSGATVPALRANPRSAAQAGAPPRAEPRRERADPEGPARRGPRSDVAEPKSPRMGDPASSRRPLR